MVITGVIRPPPEIRAVADKTALFVAKNGRAFEDRILKSEKGKTPKFAFLHSTSPFHAYYEDRIRFYEQGGTDGEEDEEKKESAEENKETKDENIDKKEERKQEKSQKASAVDPVARSLLAQRNKITAARNAMDTADKDKTDDEESPQTLELLPPPKLNFASIVAPNVAQVQLETIKLVAQFTALDGKGGSFMKDLAVREWSNPTFAFLQPRHGHFAYFSALVDGYRHILSTWTRDAAAVGLPETAHECLDLAAYRAEYERDLAERQQQQQTEEGELSGAALIDWHDFVVVETIDFPSDEVVQTSLPPPPSTAAAAASDEMEESDEEGEDEAIRVVPTYQPKVVSTQSIAADTSRTHVIDPLTGKSVRIADMPEHMRIQLLDPKWAEERKKFLDKQKDSNLVAGDAIASNISRFAQARGDLFGKSASDLSGQDADSKQRLDEANRVIREQAQSQPGPMLPPQVPPPTAAPKAPMFSEQLLPPAKRARVEENAPPGVPPLPPPPRPTGLPPPPPPAAGELPPLAPQDVSMAEPSTLLSEADFAASLDSPTVTLSIKIPNDSSNSSWNFNGQVITLSVDVMSKVKAIKGELKSHLGEMPVNKIQLKGVQAGFLKDNQTLAQLNIGPASNLDMIPKTRGGRK